MPGPADRSDLVAPPGAVPLAELAIEAVDRLAGELFCAGGPPPEASARPRPHDGPHSGYAEPEPPRRPRAEPEEAPRDGVGALSLY